MISDSHLPHNYSLQDSKIHLTLKNPSYIISADPLGHLVQMAESENLVFLVSYNPLSFLWCGISVRGGMWKSKIWLNNKPSLRSGIIFECSNVMKLCCQRRGSERKNENAIRNFTNNRNHMQGKESSTNHVIWIWYFSGIQTKLKQLFHCNEIIFWPR